MMENPDNSFKIELADHLLTYCRKFNIPLEFLFEILEDQKVVPMIRGKATEYNAFLILERILPRAVWSIQKLNLNAQTGTYDEDISITHRRTGVILKVESKSAVRGSFNNGQRTKILKVPHFKVKCHRSRSNISLAGTSNDRYSVDSFDVLVTNVSNAIFQGNTVGETLEILYNEQHVRSLKNHYSIDNLDDLINACENDWRFAIPSDIAIDGYIERTPYVKLSNDENWKPIEQIEDRLLEVVESRRRNAIHSRR